LFAAANTVVPFEASWDSMPPRSPGSTVSGMWSFEKLCFSARRLSLSWPLWTPTERFQSGLPLCLSTATIMPALPASITIRLPFAVARIGEFSRS
jgi:hypothetical protein